MAHRGVYPGTESARAFLTAVVRGLLLLGVILLLRPEWPLA